MPLRRFENYNFQNNCLIFFDLYSNSNDNFLLENSLENLFELINFLKLKNLAIYCLPISKNPNYESFNKLIEIIQKKHSVEFLTEFEQLESNWNKKNVFIIHPSIFNSQKFLSLNFDGFIIDSFEFFIKFLENSHYSKLNNEKITLSVNLFESIQILQQILSNTTKRKLAILGGNQIQNTIDFLYYTVKYFQNLLLGGGIGITALKANGLQVGNSPYSSEYLSEIFQIMNKAEFEECEVFLPIDHIVTDKLSNDAKIKTSPKEISKQMIAIDIGQKTIQLFEEQIKESNLIFMHAPLGILELEKAQNGTLQILKTIHKCQKPTILSGTSLCSFALKNKISSKYIPDFEFIKLYFSANSKLAKLFN